jgi:GTPase SAR1 family protein
MRDSYMRGGQGFLIVFAVNSSLSFNEVAALLTRLTLPEM